MITEPQKYTLRKALPSDVQQIVDIHIRAFPKFFLTSLGARFLRLLYLGIFHDPSGILCVAERGGHTLGFVAGATDPAGLYSRLIMRRAVAFSAASVWPAIKRPIIIIRLLRAFSKPRETLKAAENAALLMSIAVDPAQQGAGVGVALVECFVRVAGEMGASAVMLTTDTVDNEGANRFYVRNGFQLRRTFLTPEGRQMNEYRMALRVGHNDRS